MSDRLIELGLFRRRKGEGNRHIPRLGKLFEALMAAVSEIPIEGESLKAAEFRSQLNQCRARLAEIIDSSVLETTLRECLALCQDYFKHAQACLLEKDTELREVVHVLNEAVSTLAGRAKTFDERMLNSAERFQRLTTIEDLREIKRQISKEVSELSQIVKEQREHDQALYAKISERCEVLQDKLSQTRQDALLDPLTHIGNRRSLDLEIGRKVRETGEKPFVLGIADIDNFKRINDFHGHLVGDQALVCVAKWLSIHIRSGDYIARYGGDEFVAVFSNTSLRQAEERFSQVMAHITATPFEYREGKESRSVKLSVSCGLAEFSHGEAPTDLMRRADKALYEAKRRGKNCLVTEKDMDYSPMKIEAKT